MPFDDAVFNVGRTALLVAALAAGDVDAMRVATEDRLHQDRRLARARDTRIAIDAMLDAGAFAAWLSGSGPSAAAFVDRDDAESIAAALPHERPRARARHRRRGSSDHMKLAGKCIVVVTGAAGGIGAALARRFAAEGARGVVVADRAGNRASNGSPARSRQPGAVSRGAVRRHQGVRRSARLVDAAEDRVRADRPLLLERRASSRSAGAEASDDEWRLSIDVNVMAHVYAARILVPRDARAGRRLPPADRVGGRAAHPDRLARRTP